MAQKEINDDARCSASELIAQSRELTNKQRERMPGEICEVPLSGRCDNSGSARRRTGQLVRMDSVAFALTGGKDGGSKVITTPLSGPRTSMLRVELVRVNRHQDSKSEGSYSSQTANSGPRRTLLFRTSCCASIGTIIGLKSPAC
jgi:hypothetical protein